MFELLKNTVSEISFIIEIRFLILVLLKNNRIFDIWIFNLFGYIQNQGSLSINYSKIFRVQNLKKVLRTHFMKIIIFIIFYIS